MKTNVLIIALFFVYQIGGAICSAVFHSIGMNGQESTGYGMTIAALTTLGILFLCFYTKNKNLFPFKQSFKGYGYILSSFFFIMIFQMFYSIVLTTFFGVRQNDFESDQQIRFMYSTVPIFIPILVIVGPLIEELTFRYAVFHLLNRFVNRWWISCTISAIIFALFHGQFISFPFYFLLGMISSYLYKKTGHLLASIYFHCLINLIAVLSNI